ncbi:hypothetical protein F5887DRAFT_1005301 [Amanita rubescens]|nr:hypothetical protein F5887DRAFT_1005301 [Amanita rubescens]
MATRTMNRGDTVRRLDTSRHSAQRHRKGDAVHSALGAPDTFPSAQHYHETPPRDTYERNHVEIPPIRQHAPQTPLVEPLVQREADTVYSALGAPDTFYSAQHYHETPRDTYERNHVEIPPIRQHAPQTPLVQPGAWDTFHPAQQHHETPVIQQHAPEHETPLIPGSTHFAPHYHNEDPAIRQHVPNIPPGDAFHLAQHHHETPLIRSQAQYTHEPFANAHDFIMMNPVFNDMGTYNNYSDEPELDRLWKYISADALHDSFARSPPPRCHPGTRETVLRKIYSWIDQPNPRQRILWLNGPAGAGKTAVAQTVAEHCKGHQLAASFFFKRNTKDRGVVDRLFLTLAWQLATSIPETRPYIESALKADRLLHTKAIDVQFDQLFVQVFRKLLRDKPNIRLEKTLVIIDGVDECAPERDQRHFLNLIGDALAPGGIPLHFLLSSRSEFQIRETFDMEKMGNAIFAIALDDTVAPNDDIRRYLEDIFLDIFTKRQVSPLPTDADIDYLVLKASGQFIYASTIVKFIDDDDCNPKEQLAIILKNLKLRPINLSSPYAPLDELYIQVLSQQRDTRLLRDIFVLIIALGRPDWVFICRRLQEIKEDLVIKLRRLSSLLQISDSGIETYHQSLHDFFLDKSRAGKYYIHPARVALVRLPRNSRRFVEKISIVRSEVGIIRIVLVAGRLLLAPLFMVPGVCIGLVCGCSGRWQFSPTCLYITFLYPIG